MNIFQRVALAFAMANFASGLSFIKDLDNASLSQDRNDNTTQKSLEKSPIDSRFDADVSKYPFMARILYDAVAAEPHCVGMLVAPQYVLKLAACLDGFIPGFDISIGTSRDVETVAVVEAFRHPKYDYMRSTYDVALLKLTKPSRHKPARLADPNESDDKPGTIGTAIGWGLVNDYDRSKKLQAINVEIQDCDNITEDTNILLCAGKKRESDLCIGDWGAPLISNGVVVGMTAAIDSLSNDCGEKPAVYTRMSQVFNYIADVTSGGSSGNVTEEFVKSIEALFAKK